MQGSLTCVSGPNTLSADWKKVTVSSGGRFPTLLPSHKTQRTWSGCLRQHSCKGLCRIVFVFATKVPDQNCRGTCIFRNRRVISADSEKQDKSARSPKGFRQHHFVSSTRFLLSPASLQEQPSQCTTPETSFLGFCRKKQLPVSNSGCTFECCLQRPEKQRCRPP